MLYLLRRVAERINTGQDGGEGNGGSLVERERRGGEEADIDYEDEDEQEDDEEYNEQEDDEEDDEQEHDDEYDEEDDEEDGEEDDGDAESRTPLCSICQKINITRKSFEPNKRDKNAGWGSHTLGTLDEIRKRQSCPICSLVVKAIEEYPSSTGKEGPFRLEWGSDRLTSNDSHELTQTSELYIYRGNRMLYEETFKAKGHIALLGAGPFLARRIGDTIDLQQVRGWLSNCAEWHGENCNKPLFEQLGSPSELPHFRVIDVQEGCLATLPPGARYLALSYCWGAVESLVAVRTNADQLGEPRGIFNASQEVASTIKEAIALTSELGERYLWVDQLCIIQDETEIKAELINNMDKIYGHAHLVIVAASGSDANAGLPGIGGRPRGIVQAIAEIEPGFEVALLPYPVDTVRGCWYSSRGWTYQEQILAQRLLIFVGGQVIFKCQCALWREDRHTDEEDSLSTQDQDFFEFETSFKICPGDIMGNVQSLNSQTLRRTMMIKRKKKYKVQAPQQ